MAIFTSLRHDLYLRYRRLFPNKEHCLMIGGKESKFVIGKNKDEFSLIENTGIANLSADQLKAMAEKYFFS